MKEDCQEKYLDEVRDGFFVSSMMKKAWAALLKSYKDMEAFCSSQGVNCFVMWGSLLGAVRHGGFIPWDDDIDTMMIRDDYDRIKAIADERGLPGDHWISDFISNNDENMTRRWLDTHEIIRNPEKAKDNFGFPFVNVIDIFMLDYVPKNEDEREVFFDTIGIMLQLKEEGRELDQGKGKHSISDSVQFNRKLRRVEELAGVRADRKDELKKVFLLLQLLETYCAQYPREKCRELAMLTYYVQDHGRIFPQECFDDVIKMEFEDTTVNVPIGYEGVLRRLWPNYMYPVAGYTEHYPFYRAMESQMTEHLGYEFLRYHFDSDEYERTISERHPRSNLSKQSAETFELLREAHRFICDSIENKGSYPEVLDVLGQCQELAVTIGENYEHRAKNADRVVSRLEEYCEFVYHVFQRIEGASETLSDDAIKSEICTSLAQYDNEFSGKEFLCVQERKEVVFLSYRSENWKGMHSVWEAAHQDESFTVTVIPVPYYLKDFSGNVDRERVRCDMDGYPSEVTLTPYDQYDFAKRCPEVLIYQCPYDEFSDSMTIHPYYYAKNLHQYVGRMVLILPFNLNEKYMSTLKKAILGYVQTPGFIYADKVFLQSEALSQMVKELLVEETKDAIDWSKRLESVGSAALDWESRERVLVKDERAGKYYDKNGKEQKKTIFDRVIAIPEEWLECLRREDGSFHRVLLCYLSGSMLYEHGPAELERINGLMEELDKEDDWIILWEMDRYAESILSERRPETWKALCQFRDDFIQKNRGIWDDKDEAEKDALLADAFYGDGGISMFRCQTMGKPVMWETPGESPDNEYEIINWTDDLTYVHEDKWGIENYIREIKNYKKKMVPTNCGAAIWARIRREECSSEG